MHIFAKHKSAHDKTSYLTGSRDAPHVSTLPPDVTLPAVEKAIPLLQELIRKQTSDSFVHRAMAVGLQPTIILICDLSSDYFLDHSISCLVYKIFF